MANPWYKTATGKAALAGVIPTTIVSVIALSVQTCLTIKQNEITIQASKDQEVKDSIAALRATKQYQADSLFSVLQLELAFKKRKEDSVQGATIAAINKNELRVSEEQLRIVQQNKKSQILIDLRRFKEYLVKYDSLINNYDFYQTFDIDPIGHLQMVLALQESQLSNQLIQEDASFYKEFYLEIHQIKGGINYINWGNNVFPRRKVFDDIENLRYIGYPAFRDFYKIQKKFYERQLLKYLHVTSGYREVGVHSETEW